MLTEDGCVSLRFSEKLTGYGAFWLYKILEAKKVLKRTKKITCSFVCSFNTIIIRKAKISSFIGGCIMKKVLTICLALLWADALSPRLRIRLPRETAPERNRKNPRNT